MDHPPRIAPAEPPYDPDTQRWFERIMPAGMEPLLLFRVLATSERIFPRFMGAGVLDPGPLSLRHRELAILRTTARCRAQYEWGVHVSAFAGAAGLDDARVAATVRAPADDPRWRPDEAAIVRLCDGLHDDARIGEDCWRALCEHFDEPQRLELIYLCGMYTCVSFLVNGLRLPAEPFAARFDDA